MEMLIGIAAVSGIAGALAGIVGIARRFVSNYGECAITVNEKKKLTVTGGASLLDGLLENKIFIPSACGGRGTCAYCKVRVSAGGNAALPTEEPYLDKDELAGGVRLSCQVRVRSDISVSIPSELLSVREYTGVCSRITRLTPDIREFRIELGDDAALEYTPGQYVQLFSPAYDGNEEVYRAYSISSDPADKKAIELVIRLVPGGICTTWCFNHLSEGQSVRFNGPYGRFSLSESDSPIIFIAGGSGMAPVKCMLHHMKNAGIRRKAIFFFGARSVDQLFYSDLMRRFERELEDFLYVPTVIRVADGENWDGETGNVIEAVRGRIEDASPFEAYLCGSPGLIKASVDTLSGMGMPVGNIFSDSFG